MSKVVRVSNGDYKIIIQDGGTITLDTTNGTDNLNGRVLILGDLEVKGDTTTVNSTQVTIADNIIVLSKDNIASGLPASLGYRSGVEIERGSAPNSRMVYDETIAWTLGGTSGQGTFVWEQGSQELPLKTPGIISGGTLYVSTGAGVISVTGTNDYEEQIFTYSGGVITDSGSGVVIDDDGIPNTKAVADYVNYVLGSSFQDKINEEDTYVETKDFDTTGNESTVEIGVDGSAVANFYSNRTELQDIKIQGTEISTTLSNTDLVLASSGTGSVKIKDFLEITATPYDEDALIDATAPAEGIKLYSKEEAEGGSGFYFVNSSNRTDELTSRNRALLFSMLF